MLKAILEILELLKLRFKVELDVNDVNKLINLILDMNLVDIFRRKVFRLRFFGELWCLNFRKLIKLFLFLYQVLHLGNFITA